MKCLKEFKEELDIMLKDENVMGKYSKEEIYDNLHEYWLNKEEDPYSHLHSSEHYEKSNKVIEDFRKFNPQQKKTYLQLKTKELKYKGIR